MNRDLMSNSTSQRVAEAAMAVVDRLQAHRPEAQVLGAAAVFRLVCDHYNVRPSEALQFAGNMMYEDTGMVPEFRAVKQYIQMELPR